jgi:hypothetical protein
MSDWSMQTHPAGEESDLESALDEAYSHARLYGLWEVADDLGRIMGEIRAREAARSMPLPINGRGPVRRRPRS